jgi:hypothetical protein
VTLRVVREPPQRAPLEARLDALEADIDLLGWLWLINFLAIVAVALVVIL